MRSSLTFDESSHINLAGAKQFHETAKWGNSMKSTTENLITCGDIVKELGVSDAKVKKAIKELGIMPKAKKGVCNYYSRDELVKIRQTLKKGG